MNRIARVQIDFKTSLTCRLDAASLALVESNDSVLGARSFVEKNVLRLVVVRAEFEVLLDVGEGFAILPFLVVIANRIILIKRKINNEDDHS